MLQVQNTLPGLGINAEQYTRDILRKERGLLLFDELSEEAQETALTWFKDSEWQYDFSTLDTFTEDEYWHDVLKAFGFLIDWDKCWYSVDSYYMPAVEFLPSGYFSYEKGYKNAIKAFKNEALAPYFDKLCSAIDALERPYFYQVAIHFSVSYGYCSSSRQVVQPDHTQYSEWHDIQDKIADACEYVIECLSDLLCFVVKEEVKHRFSNETVADTIRAKAYEFDENGERV